MSGDEIRRVRSPGGSSQRPLPAPSLPESPLRTCKVAIYRLYVDAGQPTLDAIVATVADLTQRLAQHLFPDGGDGSDDPEVDIDAVLGMPSPGRDTIGAISGGNTLPGTEDDAVVVAVALAHLAGLLSPGRRTRELAPLAEQIRQLWKETRLRPALRESPQLVRPLAGASPDLDAHVLRAAFPLPYIRRDAEDEVRGRLAAGRAVLLVGPSMVGKTRLAVEVIRDVYADRPLIMPDSQAALVDLAAADEPETGCVVLLDDLDRLFDVSLSGSAMRRLTEHNAVIATMRDKPYDQYQPTDAMRPHEWNLLREFERVFLGRELSDDEGRLLERAVDDPEVRRRIKVTGIGEYVGAADRIIEALRLAPSVRPLGNAMICGCADWARAGVRSPAPGRLLRDLAAPYLSARQRARFTGHAYDEALAWATREINATVSLLHPEPDGYTVTAFALDLITEHGDPVPDVAWELAIGNAAPRDLIDVALAASKSGRPHTFEAALNACEERAEADAEAASLAAVLLGSELSDRGDIDGAQAAYRRAIDSAHADVAPQAWLNLANLHNRQDRPDQACDAYQHVIDSDHPALWPRAAVNLGDLLAWLDDAAGAEVAYRRVVENVTNLNRLVDLIRPRIQEHYGDVAFRLVALDVRRRHPDPVVFIDAELGLAKLLAERGDLDGARELYLHVEQHGPTEQAATAALNLGHHLALADDLEGARSAFERVLAVSTSDETTANAIYNLGVLLLKQGDTQAALDQFRQAMAFDYPPVVITAAAATAALLQRRGDTDGARAALTRWSDFATTDSDRQALRDVERMLGLSGEH